MAAPTAIAPAPPAAAFAQPTAAPTPSSVVAPPSLDDRLPQFTTREATVHKVDNRNALVFSVPAGSSLLLRLVAPPSHAYEEKDLRWLHLLQAVAVVPSRRVDTIAKLAAQALQLMRSPQHKPRLELAVRGLVDVLSKEDSPLSFSQKALLALRLKDQIARFLREWVQDPVEGFVLRKDHVVGGMCLDDLVATPVGAGYLRGYRRDDSCCIVVYPWGHGFIHRSKVEPLELAIEHERKKRHHNEYLALEHQHLFEQVESLLENYPPESAASGDNQETADSSAANGDDIDLEQYRGLLEELRQEHFDPQVLQHDLSFVRRIQALTNKLHKRQRPSQTDSAEEEEEEGEETGGGDESAEGEAVKSEVVEATEPMDVEEHKAEDADDSMGATEPETLG